MIQVRAVGGYGEVGRNMTAVRVDEDVIILDMGIHLPNYITLTEAEHEQFMKISIAQLRKADAIPQDEWLSDWKPLVRAIIPTHAHLDHVGAVPFLANSYHAPILCTQFTAAVIRTMAKDDKLVLQNEIQEVKPKQKLRLTKGITIEFIPIPHSTPQQAVIAIHTKYGAIVYATDWKLDDTPVLGPAPDYDALEKLGKANVVLAFVSSLYADHPEKTPSESVAREKLQEVLLGQDHKGHAVIVTTFSSHIARLKSILECGKKMRRKVMFLGRSMAKYIEAAESCNIARFSKEATVVKYGKHIRKMLTKIVADGKEKYLLIVSGHQGEPQSTLVKMVSGTIPFPFSANDCVVFSCKVIPVSLNKQLRAAMEAELESRGVRIWRDVHVSGHPCLQDVHLFLDMVKPKTVIPMHSEKIREEDLQKFASGLGYQVKILSNGDTFTLE